MRATYDHEDLNTVLPNILHYKFWVESIMALLTHYSNLSFDLGEISGDRLE